MTVPPLRNSDHAIFSVSIDFPINSKQCASFHYVGYDESLADWDGLLDHLRDVPWGNIFNLMLLLLVIFVSVFSFKLLYISLIRSIGSNPTHLHGFHQVMVLLA